MKFKLAMMMFLILILVLSCTKSLDEQINVSGEHETDVDPIVTSGKIIIGAIDYPPYEFVVDDVAMGPGIEMIEEAFKRMNIEIEIKVMPWSRILEMIKTGEVDIIVDIYRNEDREKYIDFSETIYAVMPQHIFVRKDYEIEFSGDIVQILGHTVGVVNGYYYGNAAKDLVDTNQLKFELSNDAFESFYKLSNGRLDFVFETKHSGLAIIEERVFDNVVLVEPSFDVLYSYLGFSKVKNHEELINSYDQAIRTMIKDGTLQEIHDKYGIESYNYDLE